MGLVLCDKHPGRPGPLCCPHFCAAAHSGDADLEFGVVEFDVMGDGTEMLEHYICAHCIQTFHLENRKSVSEEIWASEDRFPNVGPVCGGCFEEFMELSSRQS